MSEQTAEEITLPSNGDAAFGALMDALAPDEAPDPASTTAAAPAEAGAAGAAGAAGQAGPAGGAAPAAGAAGGDGGAPAGADAPVAGDPAGAAAGAGDAPVAGGGDPGPADGGAEQPAAGSVSGDLPADWTAPAAELTPKIDQLAQAFEEKTASSFQEAALAEVREQHAAYFEALEQHPRLLVGRQVPAIGKEGMETLRDANDAREWQDAVKHLLVAEVRDRAGRAMDENKDMLATVHSSIELFQRNPDLIPGSKDFNRTLADRFVALAKPYELRVEGKLQGYNIPVQPIIEQLRAQVAAEQVAAANAVAAPSANAAAAVGSDGAAGAPASTTGAPAAVEPPQAGITSKAGAGESGEDFSTLFGTIGLPNLRI